MNKMPKYFLSRRMVEFQITDVMRPVPPVSADTGSSSDEEYSEICQQLHRNALRNACAQKKRQQLQQRVVTSVEDSWARDQQSLSSVSSDETASEMSRATLRQSSSSRAKANALRPVNGSMNTAGSFRASLCNSHAAEQVEEDHSMASKKKSFAYINDTRVDQPTTRRMSHFPLDRYRTMIDESPYLSPLSPNPGRAKPQGKRRRTTMAPTFKSLCEVNTQTSNTPKITKKRGSKSFSEYPGKELHMNGSSCSSRASRYKSSNMSNSDVRSFLRKGNMTNNMSERETMRREHESRVSTFSAFDNMAVKESPVRDYEEEPEVMESEYSDEEPMDKDFVASQKELQESSSGEDSNFQEKEKRASKEYNNALSFDSEEEFERDNNELRPQSSIQSKNSSAHSVRTSSPVESLDEQALDSKTEPDAFVKQILESSNAAALQTEDIVEKRNDIESDKSECEEAENASDHSDSSSKATKVDSISRIMDHSSSVSDIVPKEALEEKESTSSKELKKNSTAAFADEEELPSFKDLSAISAALDNKTLALEDEELPLQCQNTPQHKRASSVQTSTIRKSDGHSQKIRNSVECAPSLEDENEDEIDEQLVEAELPETEDQVEEPFKKPKPVQKKPRAVRKARPTAPARHYTTFVNKTPTIYYPEDMEDEDIDDGSARRSQRIRVRPLEFWRNQRLKYKPDEQLKVYTIEGIEKGTLPDKRSVTRKTSTGKVQKRKINHVDEQYQSMPDKRVRHYDPDIDLSIHQQVNQTMVVSSERIKHETTDFLSKDDLKWTPSRNSDGVIIALMNRKKDPRKGTNATGYMKILAQTEKPRQQSGEYVTQYVVMYGAVSVQINDGPAVIVKSLESFNISKQTWYSIRNLRNDQALLYFTASNCLDAEDSNSSRRPSTVKPTYPSMKRKTTEPRHSGSGVVRRISK